MLKSELDMSCALSILNVTRDGVFMFEARTLRFFYVNEGAVQLVGYTREELLGMTPLDLKPELDEPSYRASIGPLLEGRLSSQTFSAVYRRKDGVDVPVEIVLQSIESAAGQEALVASVRDVTERRQAEEDRRLYQERLEEHVQQRTAELAVTNERLRAEITERKVTGQALEESRTRLLKQAQLLDLAHDAIFVADRNDLIIYWNRGSQQHYGWSQEEALGKHAHIFLRTVFPQPYEEIQAILLQTDYWEGELKQATLDGGQIIVASRWSLQRDEHGNPAGFLEVNNDITERKRAEEALLANRAKLDAALASMTDAVFISDAEGRFIEFNEAFATFHKFRNKTECAKTLAEYPAFLEVFMANGELVPLDQWAVPRALRGETATNAEFTLRRKDTGETWVGSYNFSPIRNKGGEIVGSVVLGRDVTERKGVEEALRQSEERFRTMANSIPQLACIAQADGYIYWYNQRWYEYTGTTPEQMEGWGWQSVHDPLVLPKVLDQWRASIATGQPFDMEFPLRGADGLFRTFLTRAWPLKDAEGHILQWFGTNTDIDEQKRAEEEIRRLNADLERRVIERTRQLQAANVSLDTTNIELQKAAETKDEFLANMSHELRTPLNGIIGFAEFLVDGKPGTVNPKQMEYLNDILNSGRHLLQLIGDILDLAKVRAGKMELNPERFSLRKAIEEVCAVTKPVAQRKSICLEVAVAPELEYVTLDQQKFKQVLYNLLSNAVKFNEEDGKVEIHAAMHDAHRFKLVVRDTGIGIKTEDIARLFKEFAQLQTGAVRRYEGTGLGLVLTRKIVELQGGNIGVESEVGKGSCFTVLLPLLMAKVNV
jgi:PAS domain S-box-containing protein